MGVVGRELQSLGLQPAQRRHEIAVMVTGDEIRGVLRGPSSLRLSDLMNERDTFLELSTCFVGKDHVELVWPVDAAVEGPGTHDLRVNKQPRRARLRFAGFTVDADLHIADGATLEAAVANSQVRFLAATNATILALNPRDGQATFHQPFILLNRQRIVFLTRLDADRTEP